MGVRSALVAPRWSRAVSQAASSVAVAAAAILSLGGCGEPDDGVADGTTYATVIEHVLDAPVDPETRTVVFVMTLGAETWPLDDQVVVIDRFVDSYDLRFVDDLDAAVDLDLDLAPPREAGILLGIGPMTLDTPHTVRVETYTDADTVSARLVTVVERGDGWVVVADEPVEPEVLGGGE